MASSIRVKVKLSGDVAEVKTLMKHEMETGTRKDSKTGETVPAHYIKEVKAELNGNLVMTANWGPAVSKNPYFAFNVKGAKAGDTLTISWVDNKGETASEETTIS
ncbi:MAG: thiosulfate oxidation carrier complex protein SoxZ [Gammaproteobacteria bacterium]|jgi:sulfur-oxidizing protein SoxZ|nr:MAG: thiosulfate oxidation carrier complex protein SoxZ [Gammaproteobacteria bacterium SG8_31]